MFDHIVLPGDPLIPRFEVRSRHSKVRSRLEEAGHFTRFVAFLSWPFRLHPDPPGRCVGVLPPQECVKLGPNLEGVVRGLESNCTRVLFFRRPARGVLSWRPAV